MIKVVDIVYYFHEEFNSPEQVLRKHSPTLGFSDFIDQRFNMTFVKHLNHQGFMKKENAYYAFFRSRNRFWHIPFNTHRYVKKQNPDVVIVEGLIFPLQLIFLKILLSTKCRIIAQHHGERPFKGVKKIFQKIADLYTEIYLFTSISNAEEWIKKGIIKDPGKCRELLEASTHFSRKDKAESHRKLGLSGKQNFLWVGRLDNNKDPLTVVKAFEKYAALYPQATLYMIYHEQELLDEVKNMVDQSNILSKAVVIVGQVEHEKLAWWFSAADFYISGSHREGSGYALLEAMACGCIPIVTAIPSFRKITGGGKCGFLYPPGNAEALFIVLKSLDNTNRDSCRKEVEDYFQKNLSFKSIADKLCGILDQQ
jgi:glycosyltransferase involved in cell wall biosynthesis